MRSTSSTLLLTFQTTGTTFALARVMIHELHKTHKWLTVLGLIKSDVYKDFNRAGKMTYDLSLPLCRSNSRFPLESKPSLRPMPRPLPPRPPLPPPRPLIGLSPMGLKRRRVNLSNPHQSTDWSAWLSEVDSQDKQIKRFTKDYWENIKTTAIIEEIP